MDRLEIIFGPPGTGKTSTLLDEVDKCLSGGTPEDRVGFLSFGRRAVLEAKKRACDKFDLAEEQLPWFSTLHSCAYRLLGLTRESVVLKKHLQEFSQLISMPLSICGTSQVLDPFGGSLGDRCMSLYHLAKARETSLRYEWQQALLPQTPWSAVESFERLYAKYKAAGDLYDFSDMIENANGSLPLDVLFLDEAQDCSPAQWSFLRRVGRGISRIFIAGDDDQTIYSWNGANADLLLRLDGFRRVLPLSYRLPQSIKTLADSVIAPVRRRMPKTFAARDAVGQVTSVTDLSQIDLRDGKTWLLLARHNRQLRMLRDHARQQSVVYGMHDVWSWADPPVRAVTYYERLRRGKSISERQVRLLQSYLSHKHEITKGKEEYHWDDLFPGKSREISWLDGLDVLPSGDREYIRGLRRSGESLVKPGRVRIGTVHSSKGAEADNVVIIPDISARVARYAMRDPEPEARVQYVAVTRAKEQVFIPRPRTRDFWRF